VCHPGAPISILNIDKFFSLKKADWIYPGGENWSSFLRLLGPIPAGWTSLRGKNVCSYRRQLGPIPSGWTSLRESSENLTSQNGRSYLRWLGPSLSGRTSLRGRGIDYMVLFKFSCNPDRVCSRCRAVSQPLGWDLWVSGRGGWDHARRSRLGAHSLTVVGNRQLVIASVAQVRVSRWSFGPCTESP